MFCGFNAKGLGFKYFALKQDGSSNIKCYGINSLDKKYLSLIANGKTAECIWGFGGSASGIGFGINNYFAGYDWPYIPLKNPTTSST